MKRKQGAVRMVINSENFKESLRGQFKDDIQMIIHECHSAHNTFLDVDLLNKKLSALHSFALSDGLDEIDWLDLVFELCPDVYDDLDFGPIAA